MSHLQLRASDGHTFPAYFVRPEGRARAAVVVIQEVFGVTGHIERVAEQYAADGYLAIAPALFERQERGVNLPYDQQGVAHGIRLAHAANLDGLMADIDAAIAAVDHAGAVGLLGYCWGGKVAYQAASRTQATAAVAYYGGGITDVLEPVPRCPMQFHFGERDAHISLTDVARIRAAFPQGEYHLYPAGHGFNCTDRDSFDAAAAHAAHARVREFFAKHLG